MGRAGTQGRAAAARAAAAGAAAARAAARAAAPVAQNDATATEATSSRATATALAAAEALDMQHVFTCACKSLQGVKIADFGLARFLGPNCGTTEVTGTLAYAAPEVSSIPGALSTLDRRAAPSDPTAATHARLAVPAEAVAEGCDGHNKTFKGFPSGPYGCWGQPSCRRGEATCGSFLPPTSWPPSGEDL
ncbi:uncharacterized protein LOC34622810 [Cyclospora cayetanensis]|uniref:Uncharacterized protein LOC34622810 n=1 Tax=Cyclospora cayetanensis TaxID=88456 RepID=A0A6P6S008_9EIME|nr:uncharacterized protein LOC34622810 [Cyclospora cayetanensis]